MRQLEAQGMMGDDALTSADSQYFGRPGEYGLHVFDFYVCKTCSHPFFGGKHECAEVCAILSFIFSSLSPTPSPSLSQPNMLV